MTGTLPSSPHRHIRWVAVTTAEVAWRVLDQARQEKGYSQKVLSREVTMGQQGVNYLWRKRGANFRWEALLEFAGALDCCLRFKPGSTWHAETLHTRGGRAEADRAMREDLRGAHDKWVAERVRLNEPHSYAKLRADTQLSSATLSHWLSASGDRGGAAPSLIALAGVLGLELQIARQTVSGEGQR